MDLGEILALIIVGALAGTVAAALMGRRAIKVSGSLVRNTVLGIVGALVGGFVFHALDISLPDSLQAGITVADVVVAFLGAILVIFVVDIFVK
ncbi:MAG: GlsB/YeaQ/YmgE family stress response membrane protein [Anaerolineae bacterium]|nr:GlsB/YeaQ/YmgE family stress response membrane protein [Anaerolineae bacterium]